MLKLHIKSLNTLVNNQEWWILIFVCLWLIYRVHFHIEAKSAAFPNTLRVDSYFASTFLDDLLDYRQTKPDALMIHTGSPMKLAKLRE